MDSSLAAILIAEAVADPRATFHFGADADDSLATLAADLRAAFAAACNRGDTGYASAAARLIDLVDGERRRRVDSGSGSEAAPDET